MKICVFGAGAWGTALAVSAAGRHDSARCGRATPPRPRHCAAARENRALPARRRPCPRILPSALSPPTRLPPLAGASDLVDHRHADGGPARACCGNCATIAGPVAWLCKGFERQPIGRATACWATKSRPQVAPALRAGVLSGPSFAQEVARGQPTALVAASEHAEVRDALGRRLPRPRRCASMPTTTSPASRSAARSRTCWRSPPACATAWAWG